MTWEELVEMRGERLLLNGPRVRAARCEAFPRCSQETFCRAAADIGTNFSDSTLGQIESKTDYLARQETVVALVEALAAVASAKQRNFTAAREARDRAYFLRRIAPVVATRSEATLQQMGQPIPPGVPTEQLQQFAHVLPIPKDQQKETRPERATFSAIGRNPPAELGSEHSSTSTLPSCNRDALRRISPVVPPASERDLPDIFTPGFDHGLLRGALSRLLAQDQINKVLTISTNATVAVEMGNFARQVELGEELLAVAGEIPEFQAAGLHFAAEGYRLLADIESNPTRQSQLRQLSSEHYTDALRISPTHPSAYRGLARLKEVAGDLGEAARLFEAAYGYAVAGFAAGRTLQIAPSFAHEILRTSRHRLHCIVTIKNSTPASHLNSEVSEAEIRGDLEEADRYHRDLLARFRSHPRWMYIECFMAMVFLARAWGSVGNGQQAEIYFLEALHARRRLLGTTSELTTVEVSNLRWWSTTVTTTSGLTGTLYQQAVRLSSLLQGAINHAAVLAFIDEIIRPVRAATRMRPE